MILYVVLQHCFQVVIVRLFFNESTFFSNLVALYKIVWPFPNYQYTCALYLIIRWWLLINHGSIYNSAKKYYWALKMCIYFNMSIIRKITKFSYWFLLIKWYNSRIKKSIDLWNYLQYKKWGTLQFLKPAMFKYKDSRGKVWISCFFKNHCFVI